MRKITFSIGLLFLMIVSTSSEKTFAQDPNFHIYLSFGQSNMEGQGAIEEQDQNVDPRFQVLQAVTCSNLGRTKDTWHPAIPPLTRCYSGLSPADYFGRTLVENLPDSIRVGIINVSVAGSKIELFDKDNYQDYVDTITEDWLLNIINSYNGNPYGYLVDLAKKAQEKGVIKGFLLHQGESNSGDNQWPSKVKTVYDNLISDLALDPGKIPLLAGEVVHADQGGIVAGMNSIIEKLPDTLPNSYIISSSQCTAASDNLHFDSEGYRELGRRYGFQMMEILGVQEFVNPVGTSIAFFEPECALVGDNWEVLRDTLASNDNYVTAKSGFQARTSAPSDSSAHIIIPITVDTTGFFNIFARMNNPSNTDDSFWIKVDEGDFEGINKLRTEGWEWKMLANHKLSKGKHTLTVAYREDGAKLDKIAISNYEELPIGLGADALNICTATSSEALQHIPAGYSLNQNYPNPFNPSTNIEFNIPKTTRVSLVIFNSLGQKIETLIDTQLPSGTHSATWNALNIPSGVYFYRLRAGDFELSKQMLLIK